MSDTDPAASRIARAERYQSRRNRILLVSALLFLTWMSGGMISSSVDGEGALRLVDIVRLSALAFWAVVLLAVVLNGTGVFGGRDLRDLINDESTIANRRSALMAGYWALGAGVLAAFVGSLFIPLSLRQVAPSILLLGVTIPALRFAFLERRAARDA